VAELADRVAVMYAGRIVESGPREAIFSAPRHPYTRRLLRAVPDIAGKRTVVGIPGRAALPGSRPEGCFFHPRCPLADDESRSAYPPVTELGGDHMVRCFHHAEAVRHAEPEGAGQLGPRTVGEELMLTVRDLDAHYGASHALFRIDLDVHREECLALVGESGSGKTTLARSVSGLHSDYTGQVRLRDDPLPQAARQRSREARKEIQYIFQNPYASLNPRRTIGQTIGRQLQLFYPGSRSDTGRRVAECLERVALSSSAASRFPDQLSGGERQRVAIARALAAQPSVLICDEVTSALDVSVQAAIIELLGQLRRDMGLSMLFITHDLALIRTIADRVAVMNEGRIVEQGSIDAILTAPTADYTRQLLANTPSIEVALGHAPPTAAST
jgi:peptide/nickel transport system ATP-binding protein